MSAADELNYVESLTMRSPSYSWVIPLRKFRFGYDSAILG